MSAARERRNRQNIYTLMGALLASFAIVFIVVAVTVRPDPAGPNAVDWHAIRAQAPQAATLVDPNFSDADGTWWSNRTEYIAGDAAEWYIGFVTPSGNFAVVRQFPGEVSGEMTDLLDDASETTMTIAGVAWRLVDRSEIDDPGNDVRLYVTTVPDGGSLIVSGTAPTAELETLAERSFDSLKG